MQLQEDPRRAKKCNLYHDHSIIFLLTNSARNVPFHGSRKSTTKNTNNVHEIRKITVKQLKPNEETGTRRKQ